MYTLFDKLDEIGFVKEYTCALWGYGSVCARGGYIRVYHAGKGYRVVSHRWSYDCNGDCQYDVTAEYHFRRHKDVIALAVEFKNGKR